MILSSVALISGDFDEAEAYALELAQVSRDFGTKAFETEAVRIARENRIVTLPHAVLVHLADLRIVEGEVVVAAEWLSFVIHHPGTTPLFRAIAQVAFDGVKDQVSPEELAAAVERGKELSLEDVVNDLLLTL